jgi:hypothetical protein
VSRYDTRHPARRLDLQGSKDGRAGADLHEAASGKRAVVLLGEFGVLRR